MTTIRNIIRFVFWNVHHLDSNIQRIIQYGLSDDIDVIALCEAPDKMKLPDHCPYYLVEHIDNRVGQVDIQVLVKSSPPIQVYYMTKVIIVQGKVKYPVENICTVLYDMDENRLEVACNAISPNMADRLFELRKPSRKEMLHRR